VFADQNGNEGMDVLYGVNAALRRYPWIDQNRLGIEGTSYGGQLSAWLITQTHMFKAAIPTAAITNIISYLRVPSSRLSATLRFLHLHGQP
jgi:acylaminoacyl-peptidase